MDDADDPHDPVEDEIRTTLRLPAQDRRPRRVALVVDDSEDAQALCRDVLQDEGFLVRTALNGRDALELLMAMPTPSVIVLDLLMPGMDGLELLDIIRCYHRLADVPVLIVTASERNAPRLIAKVDLLRKPIVCERLAHQVRVLLGEETAP